MSLPRLSCAKHLAPVGLNFVYHILPAQRGSFRFSWDSPTRRLSDRPTTDVSCRCRGRPGTPNSQTPEFAGGAAVTPFANGHTSPFFAWRHGAHSTRSRPSCLRFLSGYTTARRVPARLLVRPSPLARLLTDGPIPCRSHDRGLSRLLTDGARDSHLAAGHGVRLRRHPFLRERRTPARKQFAWRQAKRRAG
jgi:hypothetical protein